MRGKQLPGAKNTAEKLTTQPDRQEIKRLTFDVTAEEHKAFKSEALDAGMSMVEYFQHLWRSGKA